MTTSKFTKSLSGIVGNVELKTALTRYIEDEGRGENILITGDTGTGKTTIVKAMIRP